MEIYKRIKVLFAVVGLVWCIVTIPTVLFSSYKKTFPRCNVCLESIFPWESSEYRDFKQTYECEGPILSATLSLHGIVHRNCTGPAKTNIQMVCDNTKSKNQE